MNEAVSLNVEAYYVTFEKLRKLNYVYNFYLPMSFIHVSISTKLLLFK
ncbi:MAG: hypothetical protein H6Q12_795 [Bacteroidetes bacterium]|nr:hypothetical protein [Bacteroidota bacterium]